MAAARPDVEYHTILLRHDALDIIQPLLTRLAEAFVAGDLQPLPVKTFPIAEAVQAFRFMAQARHIGKIVLTVGAAPEAAISAAATYLITEGPVRRPAGGTRADRRRRPSHRARQPAPARRRCPAGGGRTQGIRATSVLSRPISRVKPRWRPCWRRRRRDAAAQRCRSCGRRARRRRLLQQTWARFEGVLAPKAAGAWHLHRLTNNLDFFVMFSSMVALFGGTGQGNYATANAFLEGLASHRRAHGLPALTLAWGPWAGAGMTAAVGDRDRQRWRDQGFDFIAPADGVRLLNQLLKIQVPARLAVLPIDWRLLLEPFAVGAEPQFLAEMAAGRSVSSPRRERRDLAAEVAAVAPNLQRNIVFEFTHDETRKVLGLEASASVDQASAARAGARLADGGQLRNAIANAIKSAAATLLFKHPTLESLAGFVMAQLGIDVRSVRSQPAIDREAAEVARSTRKTQPSRKKSACCPRTETKRTDSPTRHDLFLPTSRRCLPCGRCARSKSSSARNRIDCDHRPRRRFSVARPTPTATGSSCGGAPSDYSTRPLGPGRMRCQPRCARKDLRAVGAFLLTSIVSRASSSISPREA